MGSLVYKENQLCVEQENLHVDEVREENLARVWEILFVLQEISFEAGRGASGEATLLWAALDHLCQHLLQHHQISGHLSSMWREQP